MVLKHEPKPVGGLVQTQIAAALPSDFLTQEVCKRARESVFLTSIPLILTPLVRGPYFENLNPGSHWNHLGIFHSY